MSNLNLAILVEQFLKLSQKLNYHLLFFVVDKTQIQFIDLLKKN